MNEIGYKISHRLPLPLRSHVSDSVHSGEEEVVFIFNDIPRELVSSSIRPPVVLHSPILLLDPFPSTQGWDSAISVPGIVQKLVAITHQNGIDPD